MDKKCKCDSCGAEQDSPKCCEQHMSEKDDGKMHCDQCSNMLDKPNCAKCGSHMTCH